jgi:UDP-3-O-[3-hydroxymyristoyl] N-acetylglucosamine deacetylase/3-hydroxyacyl-[acyl-carrier-protein] dehydratase
MQNQHTILKPSSFEGVGLHTGNKSKITFNPAPINYGIRFVRTDIDKENEIPAIVDHVVDISRGTTLGIDGVEVHTVEHVLAALSGLKIDNCKIELTANEPPIGDGSSMPYVNALLEAGIKEQDAPRKIFNLKKMIRYNNPEKGVEIVALPNKDYRLTVMVDYANPALGSQHTGLFDFEGEFVNEFAPARTFCFLTEVEMLHNAGLIKGGTLDAALVIEDKEIEDEGLKQLQGIFKLEEPPVRGNNGILNNTDLRFKNEPARHKLLDVIGDLTLIGVPVNAQVLAARPGHASNIEVAKLIRKQYLAHKDDLDQKPKEEDFHYDIEDILEILPHRYPFLLIDKVLSFDAEKNNLVGLKNVSMNEPFFQGHFPGKPIMPGVLILESMAQAGGILIFASQPKEVTDGKYAFFMTIDKVKFRKPVLPGDQLITDITLISKRFSTFKFKSVSTVNGKVVAEAELAAALVEGRDK